MNIIVSVADAESGAAHSLSLAQEGEDLWIEFVKKCDAHGLAPTNITRMIAERIKATVQAVLTAEPALGIDMQSIINGIVDHARIAARREFARQLRDAFDRHASSQLSEALEEQANLIDAELDDRADAAR